MTKIPQRYPPYIEKYNGPISVYVEMGFFVERVVMKVYTPTDLQKIDARLTKLNKEFAKRCNARASYTMHVTHDRGVRGIERESFLNQGRDRRYGLLPRRLDFHATLPNRNARIASMNSRLLWERYDKEGHKIQDRFCVLEFVSLDYIMGLVQVHKALLTEMPYQDHLVYVLGGDSTRDILWEPMRRDWYYDPKQDNKEDKLFPEEMKERIRDPSHFLYGWQPSPRRPFKKPVKKESWDLHYRDFGCYPWISPHLRCVEHFSKIHNYLYRQQYLNGPISIDRVFDVMIEQSAQYQRNKQVELVMVFYPNTAKRPEGFSEWSPAQKAEYKKQQRQGWQGKMSNVVNSLRPYYSKDVQFVVVHDRFDKNHSTPFSRDEGGRAEILVHKILQDIGL